FLFRGDEVDKKVQVLSGGEKSRLALAKMIATPANILIMDEPTNHLDMSSQEVLQQALAHYDGTILIVSHNRYFLDQFVDKVLEIRDGAATLYQGNIGDYLDKIKRLREETQAPRPAHGSEAPAPARAKSKETRRLQAEQRQEKTRKLAPFKKQSERAEEQIGELEARKAELERCLADPELYRDQDAFAERSREYKDIERRLERSYAQWEEAQAQIERIESLFAENG
ncbi:MAG: ATP-binding cassette domain-containing protein, partial [Desulfobacteraceae bacterium]|nr:ATP-binding cassette domain-containing protein [Desulfobacteraceae bacterium]